MRRGCGQDIVTTIPAAAEASTLDELLEKISAMTLDLLPDNHPGVDPASVYLLFATPEASGGRAIENSR
jgi:hypothetical protein